MPRFLTTWPARVRVILLALSVLLIGLTVFTVARYSSNRQRIEERAFISATAQANDATRQLDAAFARIQSIASTLANSLTTGDLPYYSVPARLQTLTKENPDLDGLAVTFAPYAYDPDRELYQHYVFKTPDGDFDTLDGATYDYTQPPESPDDPNTDWYRMPIENGPMWNEPFFASGANKVLVEYGVPFFRQDETGTRVPAGVVTIDYSLVDTQRLLTGLDLGATGYAFLLADDGRYLATPMSGAVIRETIFDVAERTESETLRMIGERAIAGEQFNDTFVDPVTNARSWIFVDSVTSTGWSLGIVLTQSEFLPNAVENLQDQVAIMLIAMAATYTALLLILRVDRGGNQSLWAASLIFALMSVIIIVVTWILAADVRKIEGTSIADQSTTDRYLARVRQNIESSQAVTEIPTGILVQSIKFPDPISVSLNGYIWQRYPESMPDNVTQGIVFPQHIGEEITLEEVERAQQNGEEVVVWMFGITLTQDFDPARFPFDIRDITVRIAPAELNTALVLVPDFTGYTMTNPALLPGIDRDVVVNNWTLESSYFSYRDNPTTTSLGLNNRLNQAIAPELYYTVNTRRQFLGPFLAYLLPAIIVTMMMFAHLLTDRNAGDESEIMETLNYSAALFFVIAVTHAALRDSIAAVDLTYFEYFYILLYIVIVAVSVDVFYIVKSPATWVVRIRENMIPRLLYWPLIACFLVAVTLMMFVY